MFKLVPVIEWTWYHNSLGYQKIHTELDTTKEEVSEYLELLPKMGGYDKHSLNGRQVEVAASKRLTNIKSILNKPRQEGSNESFTGMGRKKEPIKLAVYVHGRGSRYVYKD